MKHKTRNKKNTSCFRFHASGFTLLELIVSLGVFAIAVLIGVSSLLSLTNAQKKALVFQSTQDNFRFALETIARDIRTGDIYYCGDDIDDVPGTPTQKDCSFGGPSITFRNVSGIVVAYQARDGRIQKSESGGPFNPLTSVDISIDTFTFFVLGSLAGDGLHPRVTIVAQGMSGVGSTQVQLNVQTSVSQRKIER